MFFRAIEKAPTHTTMRDLVLLLNQIICSLNQYIKEQKHKITTNESGRAVDVKTIASLVYAVVASDAAVIIDTVLSPINLNSNEMQVLPIVSNLNDDADSHIVIAKCIASMNSLVNYIDTMQTGYWSGSSLRESIRKALKAYDEEAYRVMHANYRHAPTYFSDLRSLAPLLNCEPKNVSPSDLKKKSLSYGRRVKEADLESSRVYFLYYTADMDEGKTYKHIKKLLSHSLSMPDVLTDNAKFSLDGYEFRLLVRDQQDKCISQIEHNNVSFMLVAINESYHDVQELILNHEYETIHASVCSLLVGVLRENEIESQKKYLVACNPRTNNFRLIEKNNEGVNASSNRDVHEGVSITQFAALEAKQDAARIAVLAKKSIVMGCSRVDERLKEIKSSYPKI